MTWRTSVVLVQLWFCFSLAAQLYEGDDCKLKDNSLGRCVQLSQCPSAIELIQKRQHPVNCGFIGLLPIVCCPVAQTIKTHLSDQKCIFYQEVQLKPTMEPPTTPFVENKQNLPVPFIPPLPPLPLAPNPPTTPANIPDYTASNEIDSLDFLNPSNGVTPGPNDINYVQGSGTSLNSRAQLTDDRDSLTATTPKSDTSSEPNSYIKDINVRQGVGLTIPITTDSSKFTVKGIVLGTNAKNEEFPHMAALGFSRGNDYLWKCGGSLVSEKFVLTAAHCLSSPNYGSVDWVSLGSITINLQPNTKPHFHQQIYKISRRIPHPSYKPPSSYHDIALVELDRPVEFTTSIRPACLHTSHEIDLQVQLVATGWGLTELGGSASESLQKVNLDVFSAQECNKAYGDVTSTRKLGYGILEEMQFCAGGRQGEQDTCSGDSGGPIQLKLNNSNGEMYSIIGITSFGKTCGLQGAPGVYIRVAQYVSWLETIIWPNEY